MIYPYIALIVDDRATEKVVHAVINVLQHIPIDWKVQIFTYIQHWSFYKNSSLFPFIINNRVFMTPLDFPRNSLSGADFINLLLTSPSLWRRVQGDKVLYFQIDSAICSNSSYKLTDFLQYDFIGAPWYVGGCCNGGFSIRSRTKTLQMLEHDGVKFPLHQINEDGWYTTNLPRFNAIVAPISIARTFSVETIYHPRPFAVHNPYINLIGKDNMSRLCNECPETRTISSHCP
ncbi:unnamed protein product [Rotaria sp. Silwood2]|nr:unnamed protein product [Rotaria sp. Silwood2]CAF2467976.1 unnamed protein product [Rotaria sp. Silwood2]CAF2703790.1 unnamed protein product [Rotaria sp. Silwood2]CAF3395628.1 unnamed protein product [Rotaria sp. Silwood2]CAF3934426.1 unnamed protein product [Rotaria sp. Silwood2]